MIDLGRAAFDRWWNSARDYERAARLDGPSGEEREAAERETERRLDEAGERPVARAGGRGGIRDTGRVATMAKELEELVERIGEAAAAGMREQAEARKNTDPEAVRAAIDRPRLVGLEPGEPLRQRKLGEDWYYNFGDQPVLYVRAAGAADRPAVGEGKPIEGVDIVVAAFVDRLSGRLFCYPVESTHFERIAERGEG